MLARNLLLPYLFVLADWVERFHPRTALKLHLFRYTAYTSILQQHVNVSYTCLLHTWIHGYMDTCRLFLLYLSSLYVVVISLISLSDQCVSGFVQHAVILLLLLCVDGT